MVTIGKAKKQDLDDILRLMDVYDLPREGLAEHVESSLIARDGEILLGNVTLELYGDSALLRSVAVAPEARGSGLGKRLTKAALDSAWEGGVRDVYLLTETASDFFRRFFGFAAVERNNVPDDVKQSVEFISACPVSALVMKRTL